MKYDKYEWFLSDGSSITGKDAFDYLKTKQKDLNMLSTLVSDKLKMLSTYHAAQSDTLTGDVYEKSETLSIIQLELEMLIDFMKQVLSY